jgi:hypothetical protein
MTATHVYLVQHTDGEIHVWLPWGARPACGSNRGLPGDVVATLDARDVPLRETCRDCIKALDDQG